MVQREEIPPGEMSNLMKAVRNCQDLLQLCRIFDKGIAQAERTASLAGLELPSDLSTGVLAQTFATLILSSRVSAETIRKEIDKLILLRGGQDSIDSISLKIIILSLMRDAVKQLSPARVYRSIQHRDDLYYAIIEALEELEDKLEELEEQGAQEDNSKK